MARNTTAKAQQPQPMLAPLLENERPPFVPYTKEQKQQFGAQFSESERMSYRRGQRNAYGHMANTAGRHVKFHNQYIPRNENSGGYVNTGNPAIDQMWNMRLQPHEVKRSR